MLGMIRRDLARMTPLRAGMAAIRQRPGYLAEAAFVAALTWVVLWVIAQTTTLRQADDLLVIPAIAAGSQLNVRITAHVRRNVRE